MIRPKSLSEIKVMQEGGQKLSVIKKRLQEMVAPGVKPLEIDMTAEDMINKAGGASSFKMVKDYRWTTCININDGVVHGIPTAIPFKMDDLVSVDVGMYYKGFHTDTSFTVPADRANDTYNGFLIAGKEALYASIKQAKAGNRISHISRTMQEVLEKHKLNPVRSLIGHGIGKNLHEDPQIPCFWEGDILAGELIPEGATFAIEVIYTMGHPDLTLSASDHWTIHTKSGKIAGLFEETVVVGKDGPVILT
ncbi:MAG: type I methionyl aminopeptidase [bacterium]|nr:type I methionyl aminopeptidase [bacterium]